MMSFLRGFDRNAGAIKSGGTTRRAAKMVIADIDHPEIEHFITWKAHEEQKVFPYADGFWHHHSVLGSTVIPIKIKSNPRKIIF